VTRKRRNVDDVEPWWSLEVCWLAKSVGDGEVRQCCSMLILVDKESELEINSLPCLQPVQLVYKWSDVVVTRQ